MGDREIAIAQTSAVEDHKPTGYSGADYGDADANAAHSYEASAAGANGNLGAPAVGASSGDLASSAEAMDADSSIPLYTDQGAGNAESTDVNTVNQEDPSTEIHAPSENIASVANTSMDFSHATAYDSSANGNNDSGANITEVAALSENGVSSDVHGSASEQQAVDESVLSPEEERLWSIVRANSLDFNAWTALIEETEKIASDNILKIQKVYDTFLAEFPLCYGYWKKYADHEARLGSIDKVVEVYERAVQGVTYSVDMWLHYCLFAINTYGEPETIRSMSATATARVYGEKGLMGMH